MSGKITVYAIRADKKDCGYKTAVSNSLKNLQNFVGGHIEVVRIFTDLAIICNEEGRILNLPYNCKILGCPFYGDLLIVGDTLYKATAAIASGETIAAGTNVAATTVAEQLLLLANT